MADIQKGDVVYLKSGSVAMTVTRVESDGSVHVTWQSHDGHSKYGYYPIEALTKENPTKPISNPNWKPL